MVYPPANPDHMLTEAKAPGSDVVLEIKNLRIDASNDDGDRVEIVKGVSLTLRRGEVLGLVGESGAGKSTIGMAALGYARQGTRIASGAVSLNGVDLRTMPWSRLRELRGTRISYVAQSAAASFNPAKRLIDQVTEAAIKRGGQSPEEARRNAVSLFEKLKLPEPAAFGQKYPHQVSGGQLQRAMLAMATICRPDVIVFDEPTTALDVTTQVEVLVTIREAMAEFGVAALYISHDLAIVAQLASRVAVLRHGRLVEEGDLDQILHHPREEYTRTLWSERPVERLGEMQPGRGLEVGGLNAHYGAVGVLHDVSFEVGRAETVAVVGESGSGKSTLGRIIAGLHAPSSGRVTLEGKACGSTVANRDRDLLRRIQIIFQSSDTALNPSHSVRKIIGRPLRFYHGLSGRELHGRMIELLRMVELDPSFLDRMPGQLSGGQRQRISIARALAADPQLIICDEITSSLDRIVQAEILQMLMGLKERTKVSYLFITHELDVVRAIADRILVMNQGRIVETGLTDEVLTAPSDPYTRKLVASIPEPDPGWLDRYLSLREREAAA